MSKVFVIDTNKQSVNPIHPAYARLLLKEGKAAVWRRYPFTLILKDTSEHTALEPLRLKIDPGAKVTGLALVNDTNGEVVWAAELMHRGASIKKRMDERRAVRHRRRARFTRYRVPRFKNRHRCTGKLGPSSESRVYNILTWVARLRCLTPVRYLSQELVRFDMQMMEMPNIQGEEYQRGTLAGYEIREYLFEKWERRCAYCGVTGVSLHVEHIHPKAGGTNRISNLVLACEPCNTTKGVQNIKEFLADKPAVLAKVLSQVKASLKNAAAVNMTRWQLYDRLQAIGLPVETGTGGLTRYNRSKQNLPKGHWLDAICVGESTPEQIMIRGVVPLLIQATGHGRRQMCTIDKHGFPIGHRQRKKVHFGYQTGDLVRAVVPKGARAGTYIGRVAVKASGYFTITTKWGRVPDISHRYCKPIHRSDGYGYYVGGSMTWTKEDKS